MNNYFYVPLLFISLLGGMMLKDYIEVTYYRINKEKRENYAVLGKDD